MKRAGKASPIVVLSIACVGVLAGLILFLQGGESPASRTNDFLTALGKGDVDGIMASSVFGDEPKEVVRKKWETCIHRSEYWRFYWKTMATFTPTEDEAVVAIEIFKNVSLPGYTSERVQIPLVKINGKWFVDAKSLNRDMYPALPR